MENNNYTEISAHVLSVQFSNAKMGKPVKQRNYQHEYEPETKVQHRQNPNSYDYSWDEPTSNSWNSYVPLSNRYLNGYSQQQHLSPSHVATHETLQLSDIHQHLPMSRNNNNNNQSSSSYYDNSGYAVAASHLNTNPNIHYGNILQGVVGPSSNNNSMEAMVHQLGPFYENGYVDPVSIGGNDSNGYMPPDPLVEYMNYFPNDYYQQGGHQAQPYGLGGNYVPTSNKSPTNLLDSTRNDSKPSVTSNHSGIIHPTMKPTSHSKDTTHSSFDITRSTSKSSLTDDAFRTFSLSVPYVSSENLSFAQLISILNQNSNHVLRRYLPHVHFLISCQQKLRDAVNTVKDGNKHNKKAHSNYADVRMSHLFC